MTDGDYLLSRTQSAQVREYVGLAETMESWLAYTQTSVSQQINS